MKRYCIEEFRNIDEENKNIGNTNLEDVIYEYINKCRRKHFGKDFFENIYINKEEVIQWKYSYLKEEFHPIDLPLSQIAKFDGNCKEAIEMNFYNQDINNNFWNLISSNAVWWCIINELYLWMMLKKTKPVSVFDNIKSAGYKKACDYIKNYNGGKSKQHLFFDKMIASVDENIDEFGSDIICLWLSSPKFRRLTQWKDYDSEKYTLKKYLCCDFKFVKNTTENNRILDKMIGGDIIMAYKKYLYPYLTDFDIKYRKYLEDFLQSALRCQTNYLCCEIIRLVGFEMFKKKDISDINKAKQLALYSLYLKEIVPTINNQYCGLVEVVATAIKKMDYAYVSEWTEGQMEIINFYNEFNVEYCDLKNEENIDWQLSLVIKCVMKTCYDRYCTVNK